MTATGRSSVATVGDHAIVVGASMAGLAAAAALSPRFGRVTVVERDELPALGDGRRGVPQGAHAHLLLPAGLRALEELLPGLSADVQAAGGHVIPASEFRFYVGAGRLALRDATMAITGCTRPLLEGVVRRRVAALPNVTFLEGRDVDGLVPDGTRRQITGVRLRAGADGVADVIEADLVVDATGRRSRSLEWLDELGFPTPAEDRMAVGVHYSTRLFRRDPSDLDGCRHVAVAVPPGVRRGGLALAVEGDRWLVTLVGTVGERPPTELGAFADYADSLWQGELGDLVRHGEPLDDATTGGFPAHLRRRYDRVRRLPGGHVVIGDAVCSLSPTYGQGMAVAACEARVLGETLDRHGLDRVEHRFLRRSRSIVDTAWTLATSSDLLDPGIEGTRSMRWRTLTRYLDRAMRVATTDPVVADALLAVNALVAPPPTMLRPRVLARVLRGPRGDRHGNPGAGADAVDVRAAEIECSI